MFTKQELKQNLIGCFEVALFLRSGVARFQDVSRTHAIKSFLIPIFFLPLIFTVLVITSAEGYSIPFIVSVHLVRIVIGTILGFLMVYFLSKQLDRQKHFYRYIFIVNWFSLLDIIMVAPVLFYIFTGSDVTNIEPYAVFITLLGYVYAAFIITNTFRVPWEMGGFVAIAGMAVDETMWDIIFFTCGNITAIHGT